MTMTWNDFSASLHLNPAANAPMTPAAPDWQNSLQQGLLCPLPASGLLSCSGADAAVFLHNQVSNDVLKLGTNEVRLAAYCNPKGRMLASFTYWREETEDAQPRICLHLPQDMLPAVQKRLQMFVLRAKAKLENLSTSRLALGLLGSGAERLLADHYGCALAVNSHCALNLSGHESGHASGRILRLSDSWGQPRFLLWLEAEQALPLARQLQEQGLLAVAAPIWTLAGIHSGVAQIESGTIEQFVPQMINFELVGGVNFKKGCYPGQEIVARSQYLGKLKRRMYLAHIAQLDPVLVPGQEVFSDQDPEQACGMLVNCAPNPGGGQDVLLELKIAFAASTLSVQNLPLQLLPLPYPLPQDANEVHDAGGA